jgi:hypothetical protein
VKTIVIGDIHGCIDEFRELLDAAELKEDDRLILLGDLIDRGPDPARVVRLAHDLRAECVMGNHEEKALRWRKHEAKRREDPNHYKNPMRGINQARLDEWAKISDSDWDWIASLPHFIHINDRYVGVHAGCMPDVEIEKQVPNELMRLRYVKCTEDAHGYMKHKMASLKETGEAPDPKIGEKIVHWTEIWSGPQNVVYGHYVWDEIHINSVGSVMSIGIDTGCVHGGKLTALVFEPRPNSTFNINVVQVLAHKTYAERKLWTEE